MAKALSRPAKLLPLAAVAETLGVSTTTVRVLVKTGRLPHTRIGSRIMIPAGAVDAMTAGTRTMEAADLVRYRWDYSDPAREGWFAEWFQGDRLLGNSEQTASPIDLDGYTAGQEAQVRALLQALCPRARLEP